MSETANIILLVSKPLETVGSKPLGPGSSSTQKINFSSWIAHVQTINHVFARIFIIEKLSFWPLNQPSRYFLDPWPVCLMISYALNGGLYTFPGVAPQGDNKIKEERGRRIKKCKKNEMRLSNLNFNYMVCTKIASLVLHFFKIFPSSRHPPYDFNYTFLLVNVTNSVH